ncbi:unnamed protein product (macronuclear) [Paramecium tetraurelia]|uniref:Uncharacterized protein n=1 Tax=Paramecium tetraurelia TaxID=5888 RepID=A0C9W8_PARTE|nr:uncharacterized protein GSPATT00006892001 [Paramecium tetraurelia]CAK67585.1 unnamed protein product [Paramecium tetraurelia]|eukprot:XP_001434982.1 hypothetical protein (macronuclear) [Paramecium tetraurelia strain d4-2]
MYYQKIKEETGKKIKSLKRAINRLIVELYQEDQINNLDQKSLKQMNEKRLLIDSCSQINYSIKHEIGLLFLKANIYHFLEYNELSDEILIILQRNPDLIVYDGVYSTLIKH